MARIIQASFSRGYGGLEMVIQDFHQWLIKNGHEAYVAVLDESPLHLSLLKAGLKSSAIAVKKDSKLSLIHFLYKNFDSPDTAFLFHRHRILKSLFLKRLRGKISILSHTFYKSRKRDPWHRYLFSKVDQWVALTPIHKIHLTESCGIQGEKIVVIPNSVNLEKFYPSKKKREMKEDVHIAVVARLDPQKGQEIAIQALALLKKNYAKKKIFLHFYGSGTPGEASTQSRLESLANLLNVSDHVFFEGFSEQVENILPQMDLLWLTSYKETFGRCLLEAMACEVPVIASRAGGVPDIVEDQVNGILYEPKNPDELAKKTIRLLEDSLMKEKICENASRHVREKYDQEIVMSQLLQNILPKKNREQDSFPIL